MSSADSPPPDCPFPPDRRGLFASAAPPVAARTIRTEAAHQAARRQAESAGLTPYVRDRRQAGARYAFQPTVVQSSNIQRVGDPVKSASRMPNTRSGRTPNVAFTAGSRKPTSMCVRYFAFIRSITR